MINLHELKTPIIQHTSQKQDITSPHYSSQDWEPLIWLMTIQICEISKKGDIFSGWMGEDREKTFVHCMEDVTSETGLERWRNLEIQVLGKCIDVWMKEDWQEINVMFREQGMVQFGCTGECLRWSGVKNRVESWLFINRAKLVW